MCFECCLSKSCSTPCGTISMERVVHIIETIIDILKAILARCLYVIYSFVAVWRVTVALQNNSYWFLLLTLCPLAFETLYTAIINKGKGHKWITPNVLFFLYCAIPCVWLLELKLLDDRLGETTISNSNSTTVNDIFAGMININLPDETWTLALEQSLMFILVLSKWIAPKGDLTLDQLSQLLLVNIAAGADIIELMESFNEEAVSTNRVLVYVIMAAWAWSLLQFTIVLTATKSIPKVKENYDDVIVADKNGKLTEPTHKAQNGNVQESDQKGKGKVNEGFDANEEVATSLKNRNPALNKSNGSKCAHIKSNSDSKNSVDNPTDEKSVPDPNDSSQARPSTSNESEIIEMDDESAARKSHSDLGKIHDNLRADEETKACLQGRRCFDCFCCYNEIWGMLMSIIFQDGPFFIIRMIILLHYNVISHMNIFFTGKNIFVICLLLNRIRVVVSEDKEKWDNAMKEVADQRRRNKDQERIKRGLPPKTKPSEANSLAAHTRETTPTTRKKWQVWRA